MTDIVGTSGDDTLTGTPDRDVITGLAGNDVIHGAGGNDDLRGGDGDDQLFGDEGDDFLGDDASGNDRLDGGAGNDTLYLYRLDQTLTEHSVLLGGDGNDSITSWSYAHGQVDVDAGAGDDQVRLFSGTNSHLITLGAGQDLLDLRLFQSWQMDTTTRVVTDFQPGANGDSIHLYEFLGIYSYWDGETDPFAAGILRLEQRGADTAVIVQLDEQPRIDHLLLTLQGVTATSLVAENFGGFSPTGVAAAAHDFTGGVNADSFTGGYGADLIDGGAGNDFLVGLAGNDHINGGDGNDYIDGGFGDDVLTGGAGDDYFALEHDGGSDSVDAGAGNDIISVYRNNRDLFERLTISAGDGDDTLRFQSFDAGIATVDLGAGNDTFTLLGTRSALTVTLGSGADLIDLSRDYVGSGPLEAVTFADYTPDQDRIGWSDYLQRDLIGWNGTANPFAAGFLRLMQQDGQAVLYIDRDGAGTIYHSEAVLVFEHLTRLSFTAADFAGFRPNTIDNDYNGDGHSDVLLRDGSGLISQWLSRADGTFITTGNPTYALPTDFKVAGTGDFNGDGRVDLLLRHDSGSLIEWLGQAGGGFAYNAAANYFPDAGWSVAATGDFNGDGRSDLVLRNINGTITDWLGQADGTFKTVGNPTYALPADWNFAGTGDFNGDGRADVLFRNGVGNLIEWLGQSDGSFAYNSTASSALAIDWKIAAVNDITGDGLDDLVLRNAAGQITEWVGRADGSFTSNAGFATYDLGATWSVGDSGDYNGDGRADLILRNANGSVIEWLGQPNGSFAWNQAAIYTLDAGLTIQPPHQLF